MGRSAKLSSLLNPAPHRDRRLIDSEVHRSIRINYYATVHGYQWEIDEGRVKLGSGVHFESLDQCRFEARRRVDDSHSFIKATSFPLG